jgi:hypothetical protein
MLPGIEPECECLRIVGDRAQFDAAMACTWNFRGDLDGFVQVLRFDQIIAAELFLRLCERPVADQLLPLRTRIVVAVSRGFNRFAPTK